MCEIQAPSSVTVPLPRVPAAKAHQLRASTSLQKVKSSGGRSSGDAQEKASHRRRRRTSHSASLTEVDTLVGRLDKLDFSKSGATGENIESELSLVDEVDTQAGLTMVGRISALAKNPMIEWQGWRNKRAEKLLNRRQQIKPLKQSEILKTNQRKLPSGCSCGPPGSCIFEKAAKVARQAEEAQEVAEQVEKDSRNSRQFISVFGKPQDLISRKSSKRKSKDKGKGKEVDTVNNDSDVELCSSGQLPSDEEDEEETSHAPRIPWHPEFQYKPPTACNCLLFKPNHGFSNGEIQKMRWFLDRIARELAVPEDWIEDETQSAAHREASRWNTLHPLRPRDLEYLLPSPSFGPSSLINPKTSPMSVLNKDWIIVRPASTSTKPSCLPQRYTANTSVQPKSRSLTGLRRPSSNGLIHSFQSNANAIAARGQASDPKSEDRIPSSPSEPPTAGITPITLKEYIASSKSDSQSRFTRSGLQINTLIRGEDQSETTAQNTLRTAVNCSTSILTSEGTPRISVSSNVADFNPGFAKVRDDIPQKMKPSAASG